MSSTNKTNTYNLNQWTLSDKPMMDDFNHDNERIETELTRIDAALSNKANNAGSIHAPPSIPSGANLNEYLTPGFYYVGSNSIAASISNIPTPNAGCLVVTRTLFNNTGFVQRYTHYSTCDTYVRSYNSGNWSAWKRLATAEPPQKFDLPLVSGITQRSYECSYCKNQFGEVEICCNAVKASALANGDVLFTLPVGFRPLKQLEVPATFYSAFTSGFVQITTAGEASARFTAAGQTIVSFQARFLAS